MAESQNRSIGPAPTFLRGQILRSQHRNRREKPERRETFREELKKFKKNARKTQEKREKISDAKQKPTQDAKGREKNLTMRVTLIFQDDAEARRFIEEVDTGYIYPQFDDQPLNLSVDDPVDAEVVVRD